LARWCQSRHSAQGGTQGDDLDLSAGLILSAAALTVAAAAQHVLCSGGYAAGVGPLGGVGVAGRQTTTVAGPFGAAGATTRTGTAVPPGESVVRYGSRTGVATGPLGGTAARRVSGVQVTNPYGQTYTHTSRSGAAVGPLGGGIAGRTSATTVSGPFGAAGVRRTGFAVRP
jgi:hypothetical protein